MGTEKKSGLKKSLGKWDILAIGFGAIIGWGWLAMEGFWISAAGSVGACVSFAIAGLMICFVGLAYCELTAAMPKAGGVMNYTWRAFGPSISFFSAWMLCLGYVAMTAWEGIATVAAVDFLFPNLKNSMIIYTIAGYDVSLFSLVVALAAALFMFVITLWGIDSLSRFQNVSIIIMVVIVVIFAVAALFKGDVSNLKPEFANGSTGVFSILLMCVLFMGGFDTIPQAAEEMNIPRKTIGRVLLAAIGLALLWYVVTIIATSLALSRTEVGNSTLAAGSAMNVVFGNPIAGKILVIAGILGILTSWVALYIGSTRLLFSMARVGMLPEIFSKVHPKYRTPYIATYLVGAITFVAPFFGKQALAWLANSGGWAINFGFGMATLSFLVLRYKEPDMLRPYKVPFGKFVGILGVLMSFTLVFVCFPGVSMFSLAWPQEAVIVLGWLIIGVILYSVSKARGHFQRVDSNLRAVIFNNEDE